MLRLPEDRSFENFAWLLALVTGLGFGLLIKKKRTLEKVKYLLMCFLPPIHCVSENLQKNWTWIK